VESGANDGRPKLAEALARCRLHDATLVIAKLDRLSRDVHFLTGLQKAGAKFVAADMPEANEMVVQIMAAVAQAERRMISPRTKAALQAAKAKGRGLGVTGATSRPLETRGAPSAPPSDTGRPSSEPRTWPRPSLSCARRGQTPEKPIARRLDDTAAVVGDDRTRCLPMLAHRPRRPRCFQPILPASAPETDGSRSR
jgi:hypothetical protein